VCLCLGHPTRFGSITVRFYCSVEQSSDDVRDTPDVSMETPSHCIRVVLGFFRVGSCFYSFNYLTISHISIDCQSIARRRNVLRSMRTSFQCGRESSDLLIRHVVEFLNSGSLEGRREIFNNLLAMAVCSCHLEHFDNKRSRTENLDIVDAAPCA
jgi:hypothetical protein